MKMGGGSIACETKWQAVIGSGLCFKYLGAGVAADGGCLRDLMHRMN